MKKLLIVSALLAFSASANADLIEVDAKIMRDNCWHFGELYGSICYTAQEMTDSIILVPNTKENRRLIKYYQSLEYVELPTGKKGCMSLPTEHEQDYCAALKQIGRTGYWRKKK